MLEKQSKVTTGFMASLGLAQSKLLRQHDTCQNVLKKEIS